MWIWQGNSHIVDLIIYMATLFSFEMGAGGATLIFWICQSDSDPVDELMGQDNSDLIAEA